MHDILRLVLEKASSLEEARAFLVDYGLTLKASEGRKRSYRHWTSVEDQRLRTLWNEQRLSGAEIARRMRRKYGSVLQRAHLLKLERRSSFFGTKQEVPDSVMVLRPKRAASAVNGQHALGL